MIKKTYLPVLICLLTGLNLAAQTNPWPKVEKEMHPWTRWWWPGSAVDERNIHQLLTKYSEAGIGGVEITPIYGAKGFEQRYIDFLSPKWMQALTTTVNKANSLGMGVDMNTGTGWPFGGPQVKPEQAATKLIVQQYEVSSAKPLQEKIIVKENKQENARLQALTAYGDKGEILDVLSKVSDDGTLKWTPKSGNWKLYAAFAGKTRQQVKRAAPGGEGFTLDHLNKSSVGIYLSRFDQAFQNKPQGIRAFFNDSYEVYGANWSPDFFSEFQKLKGYNLATHLRDFTDPNNRSEEVARLKSDYRETMSEMLLHNFTKEWTQWAHKYNSLTKNQSHGSPGNLLDLYGAVDIPECETFGSSYFPIPGLRRDSADVRNVDPDPMMFKFATSAANVNGKKYTSSETFTWLTEHFKTSLSQMKPEAEQLMLSGVNHLFFHGTTYSPDDATYPGWLFYASANVVPTNSFWPHLKGLNDYITRVQSVMQTAKPDNEILLYWPVYDVWHNAKGVDVALKVHDVDEWLHPTQFYKTAIQLTKTGYSLDFVSDKVLAGTKVSNGELITNPAVNAYKTLIIPSAKFMTIETMQHILAMANDGAKVIFQALPDDVPGFNNLEGRRAQLKELLSDINFVTDGNMQRFVTGKGVIILTNDVTSALHNLKIEREDLTDCGLQFIRKADGDQKYYYLVNHTAKDISEWININEKANAVVMMNPLNGSFGLAETSAGTTGTKVKVQVKSGESFILKTQQASNDIEKWIYPEEQVFELTLKNDWNLDFSTGGPEIPSSQKLKELKSWTDLGDEKASIFSGSGVYTTTFKFKPKADAEYLMELGKVSESARVWLNGQDLGVIWSFPFELRIGKYLKKGKNELKIEVANLMANRIKYMDQKGIEWRNYHEINFVNIDYKPFDAQHWKPMSSGLIGPVTIKTFKKK